MKRAAFVAFLLLALTGCDQERVIAPNRRIVTQAEKRDFGFVGTWKQITRADLGAGRGATIVIQMAKNGIYSVKSDSLREFEISSRAMSLDDESGTAIVDIEAVARMETARRVVLARRVEDKLYLWWIESKNLAALMHADGHSAVIEHHALLTNVFAEPQDLVACIRKHSSKLVGEPTVFRVIEQ